MVCLCFTLLHTKTQQYVCTQLGLTHVPDIIPVVIHPYDPWHNNIDMAYHGLI